MALFLRTLNARSLVVAATACCIALGGAHGAEGASDLDAFILAISHFDPQHTRGILWNGEEMTFVKAALGAAAKAVPELSAVRVRPSDSFSSMSQPRDLVSLQVIDPISKFPEWEGDWGYMQHFSNEVLDGCRGERITEELDGVQGRWSTMKKSGWSLCGDANRAQADTSCNATTATTWLCAAGLRTAWIESRESNSHAKTGQLYLNFERPVDLRYEATKIMALPGYEEIFGAARLRPFEPEMVGDGDQIRVVESADDSGFEGITLLFSHGWGDCPAGCIYRHYWKVAIKSQTAPHGAARSFTVTAVEETGSVLSAQMRAALVSGVSRDR